MMQRRTLEGCMSIRKSCGGHVCDTVQYVKRSRSVVVGSPAPFETLLGRVGSVVKKIGRLTRLTSSAVWYGWSQVVLLALSPALSGRSMTKLSSRPDTNHVTDSSLSPREFALNRPSSSCFDSSKHPHCFRKPYTLPNKQATPLARVETNPQHLITSSSPHTV